MISLYQGCIYWIGQEGTQYSSRINLELHRTMVPCMFEFKLSGSRTYSKSMWSISQSEQTVWMSAFDKTQKSHLG
jgi:hypothetical protein